MVFFNDSTKWQTYLHFLVQHNSNLGEYISKYRTNLFQKKLLKMARVVNIKATLRKDNTTDVDEAKKYFLRCMHVDGGDSPQFSLQSQTHQQKIMASNVVDLT